jgi:hypothetical protein
MIVVSLSRRTTEPSPPRPRDRRGVALILTLILTFAIGALVMAAVYLTSTAGLLGRSAEREKELRYAADAALQMGKSRLNNDPTALPDSDYVALVAGGSLQSASGASIPGVSFNLYVGPTGSTTGQFGRFASVVSEAVGPRGGRFVRRLELLQESFARYAYWTNKEKSSGGGTIYFGGGDVLWGPVWSNDDITIHSTGASFNDDVGTAANVVGAGYASFKKGYKENQPPIQLPTVTKLAKLPGYAAAGSFSFVAPTSGNETVVRQRIEFVAVDLNADGDSTDVDEGFFRIYTADPSQDEWLRGDWETNRSSARNCGDWHTVMSGGATQWKFFPVSVHRDGWAQSLWQHGGFGSYSSSAASSHGDRSVSNLMSPGSLLSGQPSPRCFVGGDPHLVAVDGDASSNAAARIGGDNTTFTPSGDLGRWTAWGGAVDPRLAAVRPWDADYLFPLYRGQNAGAKGVIYVNGTVGISGVLRGRVTLYSNRTIVVLDDLRYSTDPAGGQCNDILGVISGDDIVVADNAINTPQNANGYRNMDDTKDLDVHGVMMALKFSFRVENYDSGPTDANDCGSTDWGRGCLSLLGGLIQERRGAVGTTAGTGFIKRYSYDRCAIQIPPPYFPTTGRFFDNRYSEVDPGRFNVAQLFKALTP